ncbi:envelope stress response membrane protein PspB [Thalassospira marina]|uniref:Envelope stress response membrane protein PspB n=1 Tax=Thalassospira marina TaxID=2048283 RepID=A0A2N3KGM0_9PROT|nr:envelope stress response membrane protein PspB [Thalassospira marina]AUG54349.1 envelope stress response membrane protein PspB [Thalassospira marina]PKR49727.1 envelope stress response membrane protein PspB [Thalassospira marina]
MWVIAVPLIVFISVVGPFWVIFHYITVWKRMKAEKQNIPSAESQEHKEALARLKQRAERLEGRIATLESLLDAEVAEWRNRI